MDKLFHSGFFRKSDLKIICCIDIVFAFFLVLQRIIYILPFSIFLIVNRLCINNCTHTVIAHEEMFYACFTLIFKFHQDIGFLFFLLNIIYFILFVNIIGVLCFVSCLNLLRKATKIHHRYEHSCT